MSLLAEGWRSHIGHPNLDRPQALRPQPLAMFPHLHPDGLGPGCRHHRFSIIVTCNLPRLHPIGSPFAGRLEGPPPLAWRGSSLSQFEADVRDNEQVHGCNVRRMVTQKGAPSLAWRPTPF